MFSLPAKSPACCHAIRTPDTLAVSRRSPETDSFRLDAQAKKKDKHFCDKSAGARESRSLRFPFLLALLASPAHAIASECVFSRF
jgi:hypothetical protein